jgi:hypothetical protein
MGSHAALLSQLWIKTIKTSFIVESIKKGRENNRYYALGYCMQQARSHTIDLIELLFNEWPLERPKHVATPDIHFNIIQVLCLTDSSLIYYCYNTQWDGQH